MWGELIASTIVISLVVLEFLFIIQGKNKFRIFNWLNNNEYAKMIIAMYGISSIIFVGLVFRSYQLLGNSVNHHFVISVLVFYMLQFALLISSYGIKKKLHQKKVNEIKERMLQFDKYLLQGRKGLDAPNTTNLYSLAEESVFYYVVEDEKMRINQRALDALGYTEDEFEQLKLEDMVFEEGLDRIRKFIQSDILNERIETVFEVKRKNGEVIIARFSLIMLEILDNRIVQGVVRDISGKDESDRKILKIESLIQSLMKNSQSISFFSLDRELNYTMFNERHRANMKEWYDIDLEEGLSYLIVFNRINEYMHESPLDIGVIKKVFEENSFIIEETLINKKGEKIFFRTEFGPVYLKNGNIVGITVVAIDVTQLEVVKRQLKVADKAKTQFLANMSHEIRTPMNGIIGFTDIMMETELDENQMRIMKTVKESSESLLHIINEILDFSKIESDQVQIQNIVFELSDLIETIKEIVIPKTKGSKTYIAYGIDEDVPLRLLGDPLKLRQVLINIIGNAIKFTDEGSVWLQVKKIKKGLIEEDKIYLSFEVIDTGIGIHEEELPYIFEPFKQAEGDYNRKHTGTGLGLSITKKLVEAMGGTIDVVSIKNQGSTFTIVLPFKMVEEYETTIIETNNSNRSQVDLFEFSDEEILIAEDNIVNQLLIAEIMKSSGLNFTIVSNGKEVLDKLENKNYTLILMDISMPVMDGVEATRIIRKNPKYNKIPIIALTAHALVDDCEKLLEKGLNGYLSKPINKNQLLSTIKQFCKEIKIKDEQTKVEKSDFSFSRLDKMLDGNFKLVSSLGHKLLEQLKEEDIDKLKQYLIDGKTEELGSSVHKLKGAVLNFDLYSLSERLEALKQASKNNQLEIGIDEVDKIKYEVNKFEEEICRYEKRFK